MCRQTQTHTDVRIFGSDVCKSGRADKRKQQQKKNSLVHPQSYLHGTHDYDSLAPEELNSKCQG